MGVGDRKVFYFQFNKEDKNFCNDFSISRLQITHNYMMGFIVERKRNVIFGFLDFKEVFRHISLRPLSLVKIFSRY